MCYWYNFLENVISDFKDNEYNFNHIAEMNNITIANKMNMSCDFYIKHNMPAVEWKLFTTINKNETLINKINRNWRHPLVRKINHVPISNM